MELGEQIRTRRQAAGLTLEGLAEASGVSRAMLSDVERGARNPTIRVVCQIAAALDCTVSQLLGEETSEAVNLLTYDQQQTLVDPQSGVTRRLVAPAFLRRGVEVVTYSLPPGAATGLLPAHPPGVAECIVVIAGAVVCTVGESDTPLAVGDSLTYPADVDHAFRNPGAEPCHYLLIIDWGRPARG